ncbi:MAG TPA: VIT domain-containing protein [Desulfobacterales bacterium]|nr:VIT domain-containing protein [Desulfobacterales bacterium]
MILKKTFCIIVVIAVILMTAVVSYAQPEDTSDKTLSPYFLVNSQDPSVDRLPLKSTHAKVYISGVIANVNVTQVYKNEGKKPIEAIYVFPASTKAAVYGMKMTIGERTITAKIREREQARHEYNQAKQAGKSASLLEQHRPNVFQMNVANILPSDVIKVELKYTELLIPTDKVYEFVYPTVVGPRYVDQASDETGSAETWTSNPYLHQGEPPTYRFNMSVHIAAGLPIKDIVCASHKTLIDYKGPSFAAINLDPAENNGGNRDFVLKYRLAGNKIQTGLLLSEEENEKFFLLMMQPPQKVKKSQIPNREYIFIVDVSGSMHGFPLNISKKLLKDLISNLRPTDRFNVLLFAGGSQLMAEQSLPATSQNIALAINTIERQRGGGSTRLLPALQKALSLSKMEGFSRSMVIVTDGYVSVEAEVFDLMRNNLGDANMFAFGIGSSVNRHLIEGMARIGMGEPFVITKPDQALTTANKFRKLIESPVLTGINVDFGKFKAYDVEPPSIPDVMADRPVIIFGKWHGSPLGSISLHGYNGKHRFLKKIDVSKIKTLESNTALRYLWARHKIALLTDYNRLNKQDERVKEVTNLGLTYNLLTAYTSFVAVDTQIRVQDGQAVTVKQALPLPQGVSDYAVGGNMALAGKALSFHNSAPSVLGMRRKVVEESMEQKKEDRLTVEPENDAAARDKDIIELGEITVTGGLSETSIQKLLEKQMHSFNTCYKQALKKQSQLKGKIVFRLSVDSAGIVINVHLDKGVNNAKAFETCMIQNLKKLRFPAVQKRIKTVIQVTFVLK